MGVCVQDGVEGSDHSVHLDTVTLAGVAGPRAHLSSVAYLVDSLEAAMVLLWLSSQRKFPEQKQLRIAFMKQPSFQGPNTIRPSSKTRQAFRSIKLNPAGRREAR